MNILDLASISRHDSLYVSPRLDDALFSCAARLRAERSRGHSILVLSVYDAPGFRGSPSPLVRELGVSTFSLGLAHSPQGLAASRGPDLAEDEGAVLDRLTRVFDDLRPRVRARHVYVPLGLGGKVEHRIVLQASLAGLANDHGHNVFLYEERPEVFVPGSVSVRLGLLGARLPAGAVRGVGGAGLLRHLSRYLQPSSARGERVSWGDLGGLLRRAAAEKRAVRAWNPQRAFGPRLQPILHAADAPSASFAREVLDSLVPAASLRSRLLAQGSAYARALGGGEHVERYWLLLPELAGREADAVRVAGDAS